jgi:hypothetical protein
MDAVEAENVIGVDSNELVPDDDTQHKALLEKGLSLLKERGAVREVDDVNIMDIDLLSMAMLVANPEIAVVTTRDTPGLGQQLFFHYAADEVIVEQTLPDQFHHRWALVPGQTGLVERLLGILPVENSGKPQFVGSLKEEAFLEAKGLIENNEIEEGRARFQAAGVTGPGLDGLVDAIAHPKFGGMVAILQVRNNEATDARNLALVQGAQAAYLFTQSDADPETMEINTTDEPKLRSLLINWLAELSARQN